MGIVFNRVMATTSCSKTPPAGSACPLFGLIPSDPAIAEYDLAGTPILQLPTDAPGPSAVRNVVETCLLA